MERTAALVAGRRVEREPVLLAPLERSVVELERVGVSPARLDRACVALLPARTPFRVIARSTVATLATLFIGEGERSAVCREYAPHVDAERFESLLAAAWVLPRTRWVDELVARYVFERETCEKHGSPAALFLETEITKEMYFLCAEQAERRTRSSVVREEDAVVVRARTLLDESPFDPLPVSALARRCGTSESTLLRAFRRELGTTPAAYARERRLDAALLMLQDGQHSVSEVAARVGYARLSAFTAAFRRRHLRAPSDVQRRDPTLERLAPNGRPAQSARRRKRAND